MLLISKLEDQDVTTPGSRSEHSEPNILPAGALQRLWRKPEYGHGVIQLALNNDILLRVEVVRPIDLLAVLLLILLDRLLVVAKW